LSADCEALAWAPHAPAQFLVASEDGLVAGYDARAGAGAPPLFRLAAHDKPACALAFCAAAPGLLATASTDKKARRAPLALRWGRAGGGGGDPRGHPVTDTSWEARSLRTLIPALHGSLHGVASLLCPAWH